jgi:3-dehydrocarnitine:acetyl-CoA trimethylamine transferase
VLAPSNAAMVEKARRIVEDLGGQIADPREAREVIGLPTRLGDAKRVA